MSVFNYLIPVLIGLVTLVLLAGMWNMMSDGSASRSQTLMRWRVMLQFAAVAVMMGALWLSS